MAFTLPYAITLEVGSSLENKTGSWRTERPVYLDRLPPCNIECPAGENIQAWLGLSQEGKYREAWEEIVHNNPLPAVHGRVCYHPCEDGCNRKQMESPVSIHAVERFLGDEAVKNNWKVSAADSTGKKVLVVGAGPGGLSAAYHLRRMGHNVTVVDSKSAPGGMMRYGIPSYRLPRDVLDTEVKRIEDLGVSFKYNTRIDDVAATMKADGYDAAFLAVGAHIARTLDMPSDDSVTITDAVTYLNDIENNGKATALGKKVAVYGAGNTAMDVARSARRSGVEDVTIIYRGVRENMPAHAFEIEEAIEEGIKIATLRSVKEYKGGNIVLEINEADADGRTKSTGKTETLQADAIVYALGQLVDTDLLKNCSGIVETDNVIEINTQMMTGMDGVFAGGDMVPSARTVTTAVGHGKKAARYIDAYLKGESYTPADKHETASFDKLNTWYYEEESMREQPILDLDKRKTTFDEVLGDLDEQTAQREAMRCMSCGNCFECDNCYTVCPDNAITKLGPGKRFEIKYDYCKGCGMCVEECPCGSMLMAPEEL
ncbi:MAG: NAD(P)-binding protein [Gammaproteobacteria bacterium]|nr:NAD(P)-binding protein [Gammaproteobacteria bacterium]